MSVDDTIAATVDEINSILDDKGLASMDMTQLSHDQRAQLVALTEALIDDQLIHEEVGYDVIENVIRPTGANRTPMVTRGTILLFYQVVVSFGKRFESHRLFLDYIKAVSKYQKKHPELQGSSERRSRCPEDLMVALKAALDSESSSSSSDDDEEELRELETRKARDRKQILELKRDVKKADDDEEFLRNLRKALREEDEVPRRLPYSLNMPRRLINKDSSHFLRWSNRSLMSAVSVTRMVVVLPDVVRPHPIM